MGLFSRKKVVDLTEGYSSRKTNPENIKSSEKTSPSSSGSFFDLSENSGNESSGQYSSGEQSARNPEFLDAEGKRRRLARRLKDMTDKLEELSNQIYLLQQRVEVLEKKTNVNQYE